MRFVWCSASQQKQPSSTYSLLKVGQLARSQGIRLANDRDHVDSGTQALHELDVDFSQAITKLMFERGWLSEGGYL